LVAVERQAQTVLILHLTALHRLAAVPVAVSLWLAQMAARAVVVVAVLAVRLAQEKPGVLEPQVATMAVAATIVLINTAITKMVAGAAAQVKPVI
jgi:uncharacterized membrane protein